MQRAPVVILVHGAWHGPWAWEAVIERLTAEGIRTVAVDLPSKGVETALLGDLHDDAEAVRARRRCAGGRRSSSPTPTAACPVSEGLADCASAAHLIYLAAFMLEPGSRCSACAGGVEPEWWLTSEDGRTYLPDDPKRVFYNDCPPEVAERAAAALVPQRKAVFTPGAARGGLEDACPRPTSCANATTRSRRRRRSACPARRARSAASTRATRRSSRGRTR